MMVCSVEPDGSSDRRAARRRLVGSSRRPAPRLQQAAGPRKRSEFHQYSACGGQPIQDAPRKSSSLSRSPRLFLPSGPAVVVIEPGLGRGVLGVEIVRSGTRSFTTAWWAADNGMTSFSPLHAARAGERLGRLFIARSRTRPLGRSGEATADHLVLDPDLRVENHRPASRCRHSKCRLPFSPSSGFQR